MFYLLRSFVIYITLFSHLAFVSIYKLFIGILGSCFYIILFHYVNFCLFYVVLSVRLSLFIGSAVGILLTKAFLPYHNYKNFCPVFCNTTYVFLCCFILHMNNTAKPF